MRHLCPSILLSGHRNNGPRETAISPGISYWNKKKATAREGALTPGKGLHTVLTTVRATYRMRVKPNNAGHGWLDHTLSRTAYMLKPVAPD